MALPKHNSKTGSTMKVEKRNFSSWQALSALALGAFVVEFGCAVEKDDDGSQDEAAAGEPLDEASEDVRDALTGMLEDAWPTAIEPALAHAEAKVATLKEAIENWGEDSTSSELREVAQGAWIEAMHAWQALEPMQVGPAASSLKAVGGENIRDEIYSWPTTNPCRIDQATARFEFESSTFFDDALPNAMGMDGLETVLFSPPNENNCSSAMGINREGTWRALGADGVAQARADFGRALISEVEADLQRIRAAWEDGFGTDLATAGQGSDSFDSSVKGVNAIFDALFYVETFVKDRKLGWPLGLRECGAENCIDEVESLASGRSHDWLAANLEGFRALYTGGEGIGMYDLLVSVDEESLAESVIQKLDAAEEAVGTLTVGLDETVVSDLDALEKVHSAVDELTDLMKVDIVTVLSLEIPAEAAGDND